MSLHHELQDLAERLRDMPPVGPDKPREEWTEQEYLTWVLEDWSWHLRHGTPGVPTWEELAREAYEKEQRERAR
jgi:hypothetical protein